MSTAREFHTQQTHYIWTTVNFDDAGIATGKATGKTIPAGAMILRTTVRIETAFNAASTNVLTVGFDTETTTYDDLVAAGDVNEAAAGTTSVAANVNPPAADQEVVVQYTQTGTAATAGKAHICVEYAAPNDGQ